MRKEMKQTKFIILFVAINCLPATYVFAQPKGNADEKSIAYLKKFRSDYTKSMLNKKSETIVSYYADGIRLMPEFQKTVMGKSNALSYHKAFSARFDIQEFSRDEIEILDLGSRVVELGMFTMKMKLKSTGKEYELKGKYQNIWEKSENGKLSLITEAWNYNHQVGIVEQLKFEGVPVVDVALQAHVPINSPISFELAALNRLMEITIMQHDSKIWSQFYTDDGMFIYSGNPIYEGRKSLDEFLEKHVNEMAVFEKLDVRNDRVDALGEYVIEYASHIAIVRSGEYSGINTGKDIRIWRREKGGSLKIFRTMAMYD
jgi:ketosteroid isomerase-like protein